jgi:glycosidase
MQRVWLALARGDATPVEDALRDLPNVPFDSQWANFLRNHDELTLDQLSKDERQECFDAFGPDEDMQVYGRGLRRRLPTMLGDDRDRMEMAYSLLLSLPGTPVLFYGEEIGMGENLAVHGRSAVRTPMQWSPAPGAGFSTADPSRFPAPLVDGPYGPEKVNVADARRDPSSLLNWFERLVRRRKETPELGFGAFRVVENDLAAVLAHRCDWDGASVLAVHNFSPEPCSVRLKLDSEDGGDEDFVALDDLVDAQSHPVEGSEVEIDLDRYGYGWFRLVREGQRVVP